MSNARAGLFEAADDLDVSGFAPKKPEPGARPAAAEEVRAVSEASSFRSREPTARIPAPPKRAKRPGCPENLIVLSASPRKP